MEKPGSGVIGYLFAALIGATAGALAVAFFTRAIPSMMSRMMCRMMAETGGGACDPEEMCRRMMEGFGEAQTATRHATEQVA